MQRNETKWDIQEKESKLSIVTERIELVVGKRGNYIMKDETEEMDRAM